jgi:hypothetical protein
VVDGQFGFGGLRTGMTRIFKAIEQWASESDERIRLLIILVWVALGIFVLLSTLVTAWIMVPLDFKLFG